MEKIVRDYLLWMRMFQLQFCQTKTFLSVNLLFYSWNFILIAKTLFLFKNDCEIKRIEKTIKNRTTNEALNFRKRTAINGQWTLIIH